MDETVTCIGIRNRNKLQTIERGYLLGLIHFTSVSAR